MRDSLPTSGPVGSRAWLGLLCLLAWANGAVGQAPAEPALGPASPIQLAADRVTLWDEAAVRFVLLEGRGSVTQGTSALSARSLVARIEEREPGTYRVDVYGEGNARLGQGGRAAPSERATFTTRGEVQLRSLEKNGLSRLDSAPAGHPVLARAFPGPPVPVAPAPGPDPTPVPAIDPKAQRAQFQPEGFDPDPSPDLAAPDAPPAAGDGELVPPSELGPAAQPLGPPVGPVLPGSRRIINISMRDSGANYSYDTQVLPDGRVRIVVRGGVNVTTEAPGQGVLDVSADNAVIWARLDGGGEPPASGGGPINQAADMPLELYLEGNVIVRHDRREQAGNADQMVVQARQFYMDVPKQQFVTLDAELDLFAPQLLTPIKTKAREIRHFRPFLGMVGDRPLYGPSEIRAEEALITGSRFPIPGYRFQSRSVDLFEVPSPLLGPDGKPVGNPNDPFAPTNSVWRIDARQNVFKIGGFPVFYWPRFVTDSDDIDPPLRNIQFRANNYFGQQVLSDWNMFKVLGLRKPIAIDDWNLDVDYLSYRGVAFGSELGWSGRDLIGDLTDPYHRARTGRDVDRRYFGYFDIWGLHDQRFVDTLGPGPAVVTNGPPGAGSAGFQREEDPPFVSNRGRVLLRHMQYLTDSDAAADEELRLQLEAAYISDRNFLEQYYKRLFDTGLDQATLAYGIWQRGDHALTLLAQPNLQDWYTDTQWFPKLDYYHLGGSLFDLFTYWGHSGVDYANTHTDVMVNDPDLFAFIPFDPVSATSGAFRTGRLHTSHEISLPLNLRFLKVTPYFQGQLVGWDNQYANSLPPLTLSTTLPNTAYIRGPQGAMLGRAVAAGGGRLSAMAWRTFPTVESSLFNLHGLAHKMVFDVDFRTTTSNVDLNRIGVQDQLDDNTYEFVRRYFALINYVGGVLPAQYDPRFLTLRRGISPIAGTVDIQDDMETLNLAWRQRLQTKRGQPGQQRVIDWMTLDISSTYFPNSSRDNFGVPFGQTQYDWQWFVGDRTSIISTGWFEFWDVTGDPILASNPRHANSPFGLDIITTGVSLARPPRGNVFVGYSVINSGVIATSALNVAMSYWLSPKWYGSFSTSYDFGNEILLGSTFGVTRIGADFLTSIGLTVDPQRQSYMFGFELTPRLSPNLRFGSGGGIARFNPEFAPTQ